jgi:dihydropteroate synthase
MKIDGGQQKRARFPLTLRGRRIVLGERTWVMGILNVTPDSFSDGGRFIAPDAAVAQGLALFEAGADFVDVGGESTRPGAAVIDAAEERRRVVPVIAALRRAGSGFLSVDTSKADVARAALDAGADLVNDVSGLSFDAEMAGVVARAGVPAVVMHLRGAFTTMHREPAYDDVMGEVVAELKTSLAKASAAGVAADQTIVDPGIGFSKTAAHSLEILRRLPELAVLERPILVGPSRKSFMKGLVAGVSADEDRGMGTAAAVAACVMAGAHVVRVHDVKDMVDVVKVCDAIRGDR